MPIEINSKSSKITEVNFSSDDIAAVAPYLVGSQDWEPNSGLSIITGVNGSGKSQLLNSLNDAKLYKYTGNWLYLTPSGSNEHDELRIIYIANDFKPKSSVGLHTTLLQDFIIMLDQNHGKSAFLKSYKELKESGRCFKFSGMNNYPNGKLLTYPPINNDEFSYLIIQRIMGGNYDSDESIIQKARNTATEYKMYFNHKIAFEQQPLNIFTSVFESYLMLQSQHNLLNPDPMNLINFYKEKQGIEVITEDLLSEVFENDNIRNYKKEAFKKSWRGNIPPWTEIDDILKGLYPSFKHKLVYEIHDNRISGNIKFKHRDIAQNQALIDVTQLSSGEQMILSAISWQYCQNGLSNTVQDNNSQDNSRSVFKANIIIMDEPDKHLDPKLCKLFMKVIRDVFLKNGSQVIMTTHRMDTIALANDDELFVIEKKESNPARIRPCTKLLAMAKMSRNLQNYTGAHVKVYTESFDDAKFYEGIYANLMKYSSVIRENKLHESENADPWIRKLATLSRRYQMGFYSASFEKGESGGHSAVKGAVRRESNHILNLNPNLLIQPGLYSNGYSHIANLFRGYKVDAPFGIIDQDYIDNTTDLPKEIKYRIGRLTRHSLENFMYDPIFMCSVFKEESDLDNLFKPGDFLTNMKYLYQGLKNCDVVNIQSSLSSIYPLIFNTCLSYKERFIEEFQIKLSESIQRKIKEITDSDIGLDIVQNVVASQLSNEEGEQSKIIYPRLKSIEKVLLDQAKANNGGEGAYCYNLIKQCCDEAKISYDNKDQNINNIQLFPILYKMIKIENFTYTKVSSGLEGVYATMARQFNLNSITTKEKKVMINNHLIDDPIHILSIDYPTSLNEIRGHNFANAVQDYFKREARSRYKDETLARILDMSLDPKASIAIPVDLIETFLELNGKIKLQVVEKADPDKLERHGKIWFKEKGYDLSKVEELNDRWVSFVERSDTRICDRLRNPGYSKEEAYAFHADRSPNQPRKDQLTERIAHNILFR